MKTYLSINLLRLSIVLLILQGIIYSCKKEEEITEPQKEEILKSNGTGMIYYGHETFTREQGNPVIETRTISNDNFQYFNSAFTLYITNGAQGENMVSSAIIKINGIEIAGPSDFSQNVDIITKTVTNLTQNANLEVEVRGAPGSFIDIWIEGQLQQGYFCVTPQGGTFSNGNLQLIIPDNALQEYGILFIGVTDNEPESVPNPNLEITGIPFTIKLPSNHLLKPLQVKTPLPSNLNELSDAFVLLNNGKYYPFEYYINASEVAVIIDDLEWFGNQTKSTIEFSSDGLFLHVIQSPPENMMGLRDASTPVCPPVFLPITDPVNSSSRIALFIHGWIGAPTIFDQLIPHMQTESGLNYTHYWTFGYNTAHSISSNAEILSNLLNNYANNAHIDIIAHSMGGLVARSFIENNSGDQVIERLVTIGTPHHGSPLAAIRNYIGIAVGLIEPVDYMTYNFNTQGWRDLRVNSNFIENLEENIEEGAPNIPYYTIACQNNPIVNPFIPGDDDGIVAVTSALGIPGAGQPSNVINIQKNFPHISMTREDAIEHQVIDYLSTSITSRDLVATGITNESIIKSIITTAGYQIHDATFSQINSSLLNNKSVLALFNGGQTWAGEQIFSSSQANDIIDFVDDGGILYISARKGYTNILSQFGVTTAGNDGGSSGFNWPIIEKSATVFENHPITADLSSIVGDVGASFTTDSNWDIIGETNTGTDLLAIRNYGQGKIVLWYGQRSQRNPGSTGNVYETNIYEGSNHQFFENLFEYFTTID